MGTIFKNVFGWIFGKAGIFLVLVVSLLFVPFVSQMIEFVRVFDPQTVALDVKKWSSDIAPDKNAPKEAIDHKLMEIRSLKTQKISERAVIDKGACFLPTCGLIKSGKLYKIDMELGVLDQATTYGEAIKNGAISCIRRLQNARTLSDLKREDTALNAEQPVWASTVSSHQKIKDEISQREKDIVALGSACEAYTRLGNWNPIYDGKNTEFLKTIEELKQAPSDLWAAIEKILPTALLMLLGIIVMPLVVSSISFYWLAPLASKRFGVQLLPQSSGKLSVDCISDKQPEVEIETGWEMLVDPALVKGRPESVSTKMRCVLDWSSPLTSLACGLYLMTCIRSERKASVIISASPVKATTNVPGTSQIAVLDLPDGAALVLQPRSLVGILHPINRPMIIRKYWRAFALSSWLTMQLRYVVFHGPVKLIVRGNGGVSVGLVDESVLINQAATLGFSANLAYGVNRCENFHVYSSGKKELFDDRFSSGPGFYVQEVNPILVTGGPLQQPWIVLINAILKAFGLG
ncbi:MAG: hypothetical protein IPN53_05275 [Comamonadaceae bacterium]|nr:hypothetical protein [Comamonadaceae bacterium]